MQHAHAQTLTNQNQKKTSMGILDNFENAWDIDFQEEPQAPQTESTAMPITDNMGREIFWEDMGRPEYESLAVKIFSETCCTNCSCKS